MNNIKKIVFKMLICISFMGFFPLTGCGLKGDLYQTPQNTVPQNVQKNTDDKAIKNSEDQLNNITNPSQ